MQCAGCKGNLENAVDNRIDGLSFQEWADLQEAMCSDCPPGSARPGRDKGKAGSLVGSSPLCMFS